MHCPLILSGPILQHFLFYLAAVVSHPDEVYGFHLDIFLKATDFVNGEEIVSLRLNLLVIADRRDLGIYIENYAVVVFYCGKLFVGKPHLPIGKEVDRVFL